MTVDDVRSGEVRLLRIELSVEDAEHSALQQALLRARATELGEVRRLEVRLSAGYGDVTTRAAMSGELERARKRLAALGRLLDEIRQED
jgi:hypothetical protein